MLIILPSPHLGALACPFTPKVLQAKEWPPTPYFFDVFTLNSHLSLSRSLGAHHTSPSFVCFCVASCPSTNQCSTFFSLFDSWMYTKSIGVAPRPPFLLELQPFIHLLKNFTAYVPNLYMSWIMECTNCIFPWYYFPSSHSKDDNECSNNLIVNN
jgi:hypothetical protein